MKVLINPQHKLGKISKHQQGHFAESLGHCIYGGIYVGPDSAIPNIEGIRTDIIDALKAMNPPNLRWPGGCFADEYIWRDGIGEKKQRPTMINNIWGGATENNHFGTHEFLRFCELIGAEPYINGNVGTGTVREMAEWVEYVNTTNLSPMSDLRQANGRDKPWGVRFWGVGNEPWGNNWHTAESYAETFSRYNTFLRNHGDTQLYRIAAGANGSDLHWTEVLMQHCKKEMHGLTLHYYTIASDDWNNKGSSTDFDSGEYFLTMKNALELEHLIQRHAAIMERYDPDYKVGLIVDEWGTWFEVDPGTNPGFLRQQNTMRDALVAGSTLNMFHRYNQRISMTNIAQLVNVLQALILTQEEKMLLTPTYYVYDLYKDHQDAERIGLYCDIPTWQVDGKTIDAASISASQKDSLILVTVCNLHDNQELPINLEFWDLQPDQVKAQLLGTGDTKAKNTFAQPTTIKPVSLDVKISCNSLSFTLPPATIAAISIS